MLFTSAYIIMISLTGVIIAATVIMVQRERRRVRQQRPYAQRALADLYGGQAHVSRPSSGSLDRGVRHGYPAGVLTLVGGSASSPLPLDIHGFVLIGLLLGMWAVVSRRTALGLFLILLVLAVAGATVLIQEGENALQIGMLGLPSATSPN